MISTATSVEPGVLRPNDRFAVELAAPPGFEHNDDLLELTWDLRRDADDAGVAIDLDTVQTVDDFIRAKNELNRRRHFT